MRFPSRLLSRVKPFLHWAGAVLAVLSVVFVAMRLSEYRADLQSVHFGFASWSAVGLLAACYGFSNLLLAFAWHRLLRGFELSTTLRWAVTSYGISQLAKYLPGNIFHLAGRQAIGMAEGLPAWPLAKSVAWELGLLSFAGATFGLLALLSLYLSWPVNIAVILFTVVTVLSAVALWRFKSAAYAYAFLSLFAFLVISGLIFIGLLALVLEQPVPAAVMSIIGAYVLAWLAGLVTPGAPAGLGVRELVLLFLLKGSVGEADLLLAVVLGRVVTVVGDLLFFLVSWVFKAPAKKTALTDAR